MGGTHGQVDADRPHQIGSMPLNAETIASSMGLSVIRASFRNRPSIKRSSNQPNPVPASAANAIHEISWNCASIAVGLRPSKRLGPVNKEASRVKPDNEANPIRKASCIRGRGAQLSSAHAMSHFGTTSNA
ncbi:MAG: hypothetical protein IPM46_11095 [Flavobacteriales bacterium]|nr:hypothetical protein [Flavobacteriales bacterium]